MLGNLNGWHLVILVVIILLLFGAPRLPRLARSMGESMRIFRREVTTLGDESRADAARADAANTDSANADAAARAPEPAPGAGVRGSDPAAPASARTE